MSRLPNAKETAKWAAWLRQKVKESMVLEAVRAELSMCYTFRALVFKTVADANTLDRIRAQEAAHRSFLAAALPAAASAGSVEAGPA